MALWFFSKVVWFVLAAMLEGIFLPSNMAAKTTFCLYLVKHLIVTLRCTVNVTTSSFQHFSWICVQKEVIHNFKNHMLVTWPDTNLCILRKWCGFEKPNHYYFFKIWPTNWFSKVKSYNLYFHKNDVTLPLSANGLLPLFLPVQEPLLFALLQQMTENIKLNPLFIAIVFRHPPPSFYKAKKGKKNKWKVILQSLCLDRSLIFNL